MATNPINQLWSQTVSTAPRKRKGKARQGSAQPTDSRWRNEGQLKTLIAVVEAFNAAEEGSWARRMATARLEALFEENPKLRQLVVEGEEDVE